MGSAKKINKDIEIQSSPLVDKKIEMTFQEKRLWSLKTKEELFYL